MDSEETKTLLRQLAYDWAKVELPAGRLTYSDYINAIAGLNVITDDTDRTAQICAAVLRQAKEFGYSSEWVESELKFEAQVEATGERAKWLRIDIAARDASDDSLDLYNERLKRFNQIDPN